MRTIILSEHGIVPDTDITLKLRELFLKYSENTEFVFEEGDYYFSPFAEMEMDYRLSNTVVIPLRTLGILMKNMQNCTVSGNGARLWFEGHMQPFTLDNCNNITIKDFTINWKKPFMAEGIIISYTDEYADVYINPEKFPHRMNNNWLEFDIGADQWFPLYDWSHIIFEPHFRCVRRDTGDDFVPKSIEDLGENTYRIKLEKPVKLMNGDIVVLRHNARMHAGIFSEKCQDLIFEDITVHSCGGLGFLAQFCHNLIYRRINFIPDTKSGRFISGGRDDGMHITCCSGEVVITESSFVGLMDDPINVHGCSVYSDEANGEFSLRCKYGHEKAQGFLYWAEEGDEIAFINRANMSRIGTARVKSYTLEKSDTFILTFDAPILKEIIEMANRGGALALDNLTHTASFICTKNRFGSCRARSVLVSTPKPVLIADNYFESSGAAIVISGDANYWFESGECADVEIRNNVFTDACLTSSYQFCDGIINISPVIPNPETDKPFHKNIRIIENTFDSADNPILYALSCKGLQFSKNRIFKSPSAEKWLSADSQISLHFCSDSKLTENEWIGKFSIEKALKTENCKNIISDI